MAKFVSTSSLKQAVERLSNSRALPRLVDFLVLKRALLRASERAGRTRRGVVVLSTRDADFTGAVEDVMAWASDTVAAPPDPEFPYVNVFGTASHEDLGYRSDKYPSNGTAVTVASPPWRGITELLEERPRAIKFKPGYVSRLAGFFLRDDGDKPRLIDAAVWYLRRRDVAAEVGGRRGDTPGRLCAAFANACGLTQQEVEALFDSALEETPNLLSDVIAAATDYLPPRVAHALVPRYEAAVGSVADAPLCSLDLVVALAAKSLVLLTGPSGTGKTRIGLELAEALETVVEPAQLGASLCLVPVGADWTDGRHLLGYRNPFGRQRLTATGQETNETYEIPNALRLMLRAADPDRGSIPHFLVLDEMNLSHVERYLSALLSLMEAKRSVSDPSRVPLLTRETIALVADVLESESPNSLDAEAARKIDQHGRGLVLPAGLFVVGTVNVDETTYMFSPKVLDRAHVIELLPPRPSTYINGVHDRLEGIPVGTALDVLRAAIDLHRRGAFDDKPPKDIIADAVTQCGVPRAAADSILQQATVLLDGAFKLLDPVGFGFGLRVINEVFVYTFFWLFAQHLLRAGDSAAFDEWPVALDKAFCQKILPKIHGNRRQLGGSLVALAAFLQGNDQNGSPAARYQNADGPEIAVGVGERLELETEQQMIRSRMKLQRMNDRLAATGYVSFVQ